MTNPYLFSHLKILDFSSVLAGPAVGTFFAELGAEVIKVENKTAGGVLLIGRAKYTIIQI